MEEQPYRQSYIFHSLREPVFTEMVQALRLPPGSRGLDAGCGIGLQCRLLAEAVGREGRVTGLDISSDMIEYGRSINKEDGLSNRITLQTGDIHGLPFDDDAFDWAWSVDCIGYGPWEPLALIRELGRVVRPGGIVAIAAWSSEKLLPGYPRLEALLAATPSGLAPFLDSQPPSRHFQRALGWFRQLGFASPRARAFAGSVCAPLEDCERRAIIDLFGMRWDETNLGLLPAKELEFKSLTDPASPDFILDLPDYYAQFTYSMFWGTVPG